MHPIVSQANPDQILPHVFNVHFNIILASAAVGQTTEAEHALQLRDLSVDY